MKGSARSMEVWPESILLMRWLQQLKYLFLTKKSVWDEMKMKKNGRLMEIQAASDNEHLQTNSNYNNPSTSQPLHCSLFL